MENIKVQVLYRVYTVTGLLLVVALFILAQVIRIQVREGKALLEKADEAHIRLRKVEADRGNIFDLNGSLLATTIPVYTLHLDCGAEGIRDTVTFSKNIDSLSILLSLYVDNSYTPGAWKAYLSDARKARTKFLMIKRQLSFAELQFIRTFPIFRLGRYRSGLLIERESRRHHPFDMLAHRTIGYVRDDKPVGIERSYDKALKGGEGEQLMMRLSADQWIPLNDITEIDPEPGKDVVTTLDINLQDIVETALLKAVTTHDADHGCAILMDVKTGAIRAIANIGRTEKNEWWETLNFAVTESLEPGSTFKLATMTALLEENAVKLTDTIDVHKGITEINGETMEDAEKHGLTLTTVQHAFEISSNVGIGTMANTHFNQTDAARRKFVRYLKGFHLTEKTGIDIDGEGMPKVTEVGAKTWSGTTVPWSAIGYEVSETPLQMLRFYNAVANGGKMMKPYLVSEIQQDGHTTEVFRPQVVESSIASHGTIEKLRELLKGVVANGTAKNISTPRYLIAGKTGTAIVNFNSAKETAKKYQASFVGFFPADNPIYSCIVVVNNPRAGGFYGALAAAPAFREIADKCYSRAIASRVALNFGQKPPYVAKTMPQYNAGFAPDIRRLLAYNHITALEASNIPTATTNTNGTPPKNDKSKEKPDWILARAVGDTLLLQPRRWATKTVPNVVGMGLRDAMFILESAGLHVRFSGVGKVVGQSVEAGAGANGQTVALELD